MKCFVKPYGRERARYSRPALIRMSALVLQTGPRPDKRCSPPRSRADNRYSHLCHTWGQTIKEGRAEVYLSRQMVFDRVPYKVGRGTQPELFQQPGSIGADGLHAQGHVVGNGRDGFALSE